MDTGYPMSKSTNPMLMLAHTKFIHKLTHIQQTPKQKQQAWFILRMGSPNGRVMGPIFGRIFKGLECVVLIFLGGKRHLFSSRQLALVCFVLRMPYALERRTTRLPQPGLVGQLLKFP